MTADDVARIERSLGIMLPESYRAAVVPYPLPAAAGNSDLALWDDPDRLIAYNLELRRGAPGGVKPWPARFFALGHAGDGSPHALDLGSGDAVWWVDHSHLDNPGTGRDAESFAPWAADYFRVLREEMAGEGVNPEGTPAQRAAAEARGAKQQGLGCLLVVLVVVGLALGIRWLLF